MILGIIIFLLTIIGCVILYCYDKDPDVFLFVIIGGILSIATMFVSATIWSGIMIKDNKTQLNTISVQNIYTLQTESNIDGAFCLGSGYIEENAYYYYYVQDDNGLYQLNKLQVEDCLLKLSDDESPKYIKQKLVSEHSNWFFAFGNKLVNQKTELYILVVPTNTIQINSFNGMIE